ncbi:hypothetical protein SEF58_09190 [Neomoorella humiferrea]
MRRVKYLAIERESFYDTYQRVLGSRERCLSQKPADIPGFKPQG